MLSDWITSHPWIWRFYQIVLKTLGPRIPCSSCHIWRHWRCFSKSKEGRFLHHWMLKDRFSAQDSLNSFRFSRMLVCILGAFKAPSCAQWLSVFFRMLRTRLSRTRHIEEASLTLRSSFWFIVRDTSPPGLPLFSPDDRSPHNVPSLQLVLFLFCLFHFCPLCLRGREMPWAVCEVISGTAEGKDKEGHACLCVCKCCTALPAVHR